MLDAALTWTIRVLIAAFVCVLVYGVFVGIPGQFRYERDCEARGGMVVSTGRYRLTCIRAEHL